MTLAAKAVATQQAIPYNKSTFVVFSEVEFDYGQKPFFDPTSNPIGLTVPPSKGGLYQAVFTYDFLPGPAGPVVITVSKNGALPIAVESRALDGNELQGTATGVKELAPGDRVLVSLNQATGADLLLNTATLALIRMP